MAEMAEVPLTRREALRAGAALAGALAVPKSVRDALAAAPRCGRLSDIDHVVIFVQENRSFDHYFGTYRGVRGFAARDGRFAQPGYPAPGYDGKLLPFHIDSNANGQCTHDITHDWGPQHRSWNGGAMDGFVREHLAAEGMADGPLTMGYYRRDDLPFYYALADAFTICDGFHCSVLGPTDPNQLYLASGMLDPEGRYGGPILETFGSDRISRYGTLTYTTMPEQLEARGVSWKVYSSDNATPTEDPAFPFFRNLQQNPALHAKALEPTFPMTFRDDCASGALPQVSWVYATIAESEHPPAPIELGEQTAGAVLGALTSNPALWQRTALFITWDENGGFFDHVRPPTPPAGTPGEFVTAATLPSAAQGIRGPIGLGFRVPLLVVSPFSRGGFVCSDRFDHSSILQFVEARFGAEVPYLSDWRRSVTGDLQSAFNFAAPDASVPALPDRRVTDPAVLGSNCAIEPSTIAGVPNLTPYPVPPNAMPGQEPGSARRPSGPCGAGGGPARKARRKHRRHKRKHRHRHHRHRHRHKRRH
jgi:phospholipase C